VDLIVFDGLQEGELRRLVLVEVKAAKTAGLTERERRIRDAINAGSLQLAWEVLHVKR
jgi:predicted Holliday junction resolvase-like endonuclease